MKVCELCSRTACLYCDSDQASLCYDCDLMVHSANFLVAKHSRTLLCHKCQSSTSWIASGLDLCRAASTCANCTDDKVSQTTPSGNGVGDEYCFVYDDVDDEIHDETDEEERDYSYGDNEEEDEENQVVPWSSEPPPPTAAAALSSEEFSSSRFASESLNSELKRKRQIASLETE